MLPHSPSPLSIVLIASSKSSQYTYCKLHLQLHILVIVVAAVAQHPRFHPSPTLRLRQATHTPKARTLVPARVARPSLPDH